MRPVLRTLRAIALGAALVAVPAVSLAVPASAATGTTCPVVSWGSLPKDSGLMTPDQVTNVRTGRHTCFDRLVVDLGSSAWPVGYHVSYVPEVTQDGSGFPVPLAGGAFLQVVVRAPAYNSETGTLTYNPARWDQLSDVSGYRTFRQVAFAGTFEGQSTIGLGVRARLPMRVWVLDGPGAGQRLVVDVAHRWGSF